MLSSFSGSSVIHKVDGRTTLSAGSLLDNLHWHYVTIKRVGRQVNFTVDSQTVTAICNGEFTHLDLDKKVPHGWLLYTVIICKMYTDGYDKQCLHSLKNNPSQSYSRSVKWCLYLQRPRPVSSYFADVSG